MIRFAALTAALLLAFLSPLPALAQPAGGYVAVPNTQPTKTSFIARSTPFAWRNGAYVAPTSPERAKIMCELVVKEVGTLSSFSAGGTAFAADDLAKCNARAR